MENKSDNFEKAVREKYEGFEPSSPDELWDKLNKRIDTVEREKKLSFFYRKALYATAASIVLLLAFALMFYKFLWHPSKESAAVVPRKSAPEVQMPVDSLVQKNNPQTAHKEYPKESPSVDAVNIPAMAKKTKVDALSFESQENRTTQNLPDSSKLFLNRYSTLVYVSRSEIELHGEGFFDVAHDPSHPFEVAAGKAKVRVLGTAFNLKENQHGTVELYVLRGKVLFFPVNAPAKGMIVLPGETATLLTNGNVEKINKENENVLAWKEEKLVFDNMKMSEVAETLSNYFNTSVVLQNPMDRDCPFTGSFRKPELEKILKIISGTFSMTYEKSGNKIILQGNGCK